MSTFENGNNNKFVFMERMRNLQKGITLLISVTYVTPILMLKSENKQRLEVLIKF